MPLNSAAGKTFENQDYRLTVHDVRPSPNSHHTLVELSIKAVDPDQSVDHTESDASFGDGPQRADPQRLQIEVIDSTRPIDYVVPIGSGRRDWPVYAYTDQLAADVSAQRAALLHSDSRRRYGSV